MTAAAIAPAPGRQSWRWEGPTRPHSAAHFSALERWAVPLWPRPAAPLGETAIIGQDADGPYVRDASAPGPWRCLPSTTSPSSSTGDTDRNRALGRLSGLSTLGDEVLVHGVLVDSVQDGYEAVEHSRVMLVGVGLVPQPAYRAARLSRSISGGARCGSLHSSGGWSAGGADVE